MVRNYINKHIFDFAAIILSLFLAVAGCDAEGYDAAEHAVLKKTDKDIEIYENTEHRDTEETMDAEDGRQSLAKRMCGKYSYHIGGGTAGTMRNTIPCTSYRSEIIYMRFAIRQEWTITGHSRPIAFG